MEECSTHPLIYEPGTSWLYSSSLDWAGKLVERVTGLTLEEYMKANIWQPLGIKDMTFWPDQHPEFKSRMAGMAIRDEETGKVIHDLDEPPWPQGKDCYGGHGASGSMPEYFKILRSLLADDEKLLRRSTTAQMFQPQLTKESREAQRSIMAESELVKQFVGEFPQHIPMDHGLGGILTREADEGWRGQHTMMWSGLPNLFWVCSQNLYSLLYRERVGTDLYIVHRPQNRSLRLVRRSGTAARRRAGREDDYVVRKDYVCTACRASNEMQDVKIIKIPPP